MKGSGKHTLTLKDISMIVPFVTEKGEGLVFPSLGFYAVKSEYFHSLDFRVIMVIK